MPPDKRKVAVLAAVPICAAAVTYGALRFELWSTPPWSMDQPNSPPHTEADYPDWFIDGRAHLFAWSAPVLCLSSALAGWFLGRSFYPPSPTLSRSAALSIAWPALAFPLLGYFGLTAFFFIAFAVFGAGAVITGVMRKRIGDTEACTSLVANVIWCVLLYVFSLSWDGVYGD